MASALAEASEYGLISGNPAALDRSARDLLDAVLVAVLRLDEARGTLTVETWAGGRGRIRTDAFPAEGAWAQLLGGEPACIEHMQRPVDVEGQEIRDVDDGRDQPQPDRFELGLQPSRARPVAEAANVPAEE